MANALCQDTLDQVRNIFMVSGSIRQTVKVTGVSRNAVRSYLRQEGIAFKVVAVSNQPVEFIRVTMKRCAKV